MNYVFDVDGTLTPSREKIDPEFHDFFLNFSSKQTVYLVTGSDYPKTLEQLGEKICTNVEGIFNCSGNMLTRRNVVMYVNDFELLDTERIMLESELRTSGFPVRTGNHIEKRIGCVNFSIVGRNASKAEREQYKVWDEATNERRKICDVLNTMFNRLECVIGGETGIDIFLKGHDKSQIAKYVRPFVFFGDRCEVGGNDHTIFKAANNGYHVKDWQETYRILKAMRLS
jgi:phosphomannomutase